MTYNRVLSYGAWYIIASAFNRTDFTKGKLNTSANIHFRICLFTSDNLNTRLLAYDYLNTLLLALITWILGY